MGWAWGEAVAETNARTVIGLRLDLGLELGLGLE